MDDATLFDEVLQLTVRRQAGEASDEDLARLERMLGDSRQAIVYYLQIVEDGLTVHESAETRAASRRNSGFASDDFADSRGCETVRFRRYFPHTSTAWFRLAAACLAVVACGALLPWSSMLGGDAAAKSSRIAQIVNISGVEWANSAPQYRSWSHLVPGDRVAFRQGLMNVFVNHGVELLIEGPAEVRFESLDRVVVSEGKLAARVGPDAIGFRIETPHANVIDRGTSFGVTVDNTRQTDVMVYDGIVDLDVVGQGGRPRRRLATGEALSVNNHGDLSRIASVHGGEFLPAPQVRAGASRRTPIIQSVADNIRLTDMVKCNRVVPGGFEEDCRAYVDREHEWNGVDSGGLPPCLLGGDYVMTFNEDKTDTGLELTVVLAQPAHLYLLIDNRVPPPDWLVRDFVDTGLEVGLDEVHRHVKMEAAIGPGFSLDQVYSVWHREVKEASSVTLGPLGREHFSKPARVVQRGMYGIVATPISQVRGG